MSHARRSHQMHPHFHLRKRHLAFSAASLGALAVVATMPQLLGDQVGAAFDGLLAASPAWLWLAALSFGAALVFSACAWRSALERCGGDSTHLDATTRYAVGSLVNSLAPAKIGSALRFALFARTLDGEGRLWTTGGVATSVGVARSIWLGVLLGFAAASGVLPAWPLAVLVLLVGVAIAAAIFARRRRPRGRMTHVFDAFRAFGQCPRAAAELIGWIGLATLARIGAATAIAAAFGVHQPLTAALLIVPALDLAGILPLTPGNIGVASAAVAFALRAHGAGTDAAISAGIAFSAVETVTSLALGLGSVLFMVGSVPGARRWTAAAAGATGCLALGAAFGATVVGPLI
jgi:uncharacterized membrane protein YbhN (UPF0104 family)